jgi:hypothetical protein
MLILTACGAEVKRASLPIDIIPRDTMVMVLKDMNLVESHIQMTYGQVGRYHKIMKKSANEIFRKYHIDSNRYITSFEYYGSHQELMTKMYQEALDSIDVELARISSDN